jgi:thiamine-phosphate pyrophosphorylase
MTLPRLYAILDIDFLASRGQCLTHVAGSLRDGGVRLVQLRDKPGSPQQILANAALLQEIFSGTGAALILNDRPDLAALADIFGVHVGQQDLAPDDARAIVGADRMVGISTHSEAQVRAADATSADYIAIGPVFPTGSKQNPDPVVGLDGVRLARSLTRKPVVAIGGITRANTRSVIEAGADSVAVISALFAPGETVEQVARDFLSILG